MVQNYTVQTEDIKQSWYSNTHDGTIDVAPPKLTKYSLVERKKLYSVVLASGAFTTATFRTIRNMEGFLAPIYFPTRKPF